MRDRPVGPTPAEVVRLLDQYVIGQAAAKRAMAVALRNRARRKAVAEDLRAEIHPKNLLLVGPTGVGKTEIARRVAQMIDAPFLKVEATKFSEVGYVGRDVESMVRDLVEVAMNLELQKAQKAVREKAEEIVEHQLLDALAGMDPWETGPREDAERRRAELVEPLRSGALEDRPVTVYLMDSGGGRMDVLSGQGLEEMSIQLKNLFPQQNRAVAKTLRVKDARRRLLDERYRDLVDEDQAANIAIHKVQDDGVIFLDELDKIAMPADRAKGAGPDVSREGVQRDLLPLVEGTTVRTKYGPVSTDHVLFVGAGAFHQARVTDLIPELLGRFPIRVRLRSLEEADLKRILLEPKNSLLRQYEALLATEGVRIEIDASAADAMAAFAARANKGRGNLGARRLHAVVERVLEDLLYLAPDGAPGHVVVDEEYVKKALGGIAEIGPDTEPEADEEDGDDAEGGES